MTQRSPTKKRSKLSSMESVQEKTDVSFAQSESQVGELFTPEAQVELQHWKEQVEVRQARIDLNDDLQKQVEELKRQLSESHETNEEQKMLIDALHKTIAAQNKHIAEQLEHMKKQTSEIGTLTNQISSLNDTVQSLRKHIDEQQGHMNEQQVHIDRLHVQIVDQNVMIARVEAHNKELNKVISTLHQDKERLHLDLTNASDLLNKLEEKLHTQHKINLGLLEEIKFDEEVIKELLEKIRIYEPQLDFYRRQIVTLKMRLSIYMPVGDDPTDLKMAEYLNNYPDHRKLKVMFMREASGVYQFGTKRVSVEVNQGHIKVRVGGGYMSIDEFLEQYTPTEVEKLARNDPLVKFASKVAITKTIEGRNVSPTKAI